MQGRSFESLIVFDDAQKSQKFLKEVSLASSQSPTIPWEMVIGILSDYAIATFRGYRNDGYIVIVGYVQPEESSDMQQEMLELTSELAEAQREVRRQNRALQQAVADQRQLMRILMKKSAPAVPIWDSALLLSLIGDMQSEQAEKMIHEIWQRAGENSARYVILDMSSIKMSNAQVIRDLIRLMHMVERLGLRTVLTDGGSGVARAMAQVEQERQLEIYSDIHRAIAYIGVRTVEEQAQHHQE